MDGKLKKRSKKRRTRRKASKKDVGVKNKEQFSLHDVSLDDCANAPTRDHVFKKVSKKMASSTGSFALLRQPEKLEKVQEVAEVFTASDDESSWYDRSDIGETDDETSERDEVNLDSEDNELFKEVIVLSNTGSRERTNTICKVLTHPEVCYPLDLWFILANYIKPEQIQTFACICRGSYQAVNTISFWSRLYERFIPKTTNLPARLKSDWIESRDGYKCRVVRALFLAYEILRNRLAQQTLETTRDTHVTSRIVGLRCCRAWYGIKNPADSSKMYVFYFKFKCNYNPSKVSLCDDGERSHYLNANNERDFIVFKITVSNFIRTPSVSGESLTDISVNLSRNLRFHCIKMTFHTFRRDGKYRKGDGKVIVLDPVSEFCLLRWWHPVYPHCAE